MIGIGLKIGVFFKNTEFTVNGLTLLY